MARNLNQEQKLRIQILQETQQICKDTVSQLDLEMDSKVVELVSELIWKKLRIYGLDLEQFAKHGKRSLVMADDVKLLVRRNESLKSHLEEMIEDTKEIKKKKKKEDKSK